VAPPAATQARLADACVDDGLAEAWGAALQTNCTLERLNLESNAVGTRGVRALAAALRVNRSLRELKLCNQRVRYSPLDAGCPLMQPPPLGAAAAPQPPPRCPQLSCDQRAEEELAEALESNRSLLKLTADLRSTRARDLSSKLLLRNQAEARARARAAAAAPAAAAPAAAAPAAAAPAAAAPAAAAPAAAPLEHEVQTDAGPGVQPAGLQHSVLARPRRRGRAKVGHPSVELPLHTLAAPGVASPL